MNFNKKQSNVLTVQRAFRLQQIFQEKKWNTSTVFGINEYDKFCEMLTYLDDELQDLIIELTNDFLVVTQNEYLEYFLIAFDKYANSQICENRKRIIIVPLLRPSDFGQTKSSICLYYFVKSNRIALQNRYNKFQICTLDSINNIDDPILAYDKNNDIICLIDDFIGTGETAIEAAAAAYDKGVDQAGIVIISLVAQKQGISAVKPYVAATYVAVERDKGISDSEMNVTEKKELMLKIEAILKVNKKFSFGYGQSEALVRMIRTPNNTFPVYWFPKKNGIPVVPFPRG